MKLRSFIVRIAIPSLMVLLGVGCCVWFHFHPRQLPLSQCSELFRQYYRVDGINASYLKEFSLDDTLTVPVTVLTAADSSIWFTLVQELHIPEVIIARMQSDTSAVISKMTRKGQYDQPPDSSMANNELVFLYPVAKTLFVFHLESETQYDAIFSYKYRMQKHPLNIN
ncbi:MAG: hypothetical protein IJ524_02920 [Bacteroidales bacterium]|nr:hypothetical protein [Bacteroidales bacterium]